MFVGPVPVGFTGPDSVLERSIVAILPALNLGSRSVAVDGAINCLPAQGLGMAKSFPSSSPEIITAEHPVPSGIVTVRPFFSTSTLPSRKREFVFESLYS